MKIIISIILIFTMTLDIAIGQPLRFEEDEWEDETSVSMEWEAAPIDITVGDLELKVWILHKMVAAPEGGYLVLKPDWIEIRRMLDGLDDEIKRVKSVERLSCDKSLAEKDLFCKNLNTDLIKEIEEQKTIILSKEEEIKVVKKESLWTKIIAGSTIVGLSVISIYQATK